MVARLLQKMRHLEHTGLLQDLSPAPAPGTISVLNAQIHEILTAEFEVTPVKYQTPCYLCMSVYDPLLRFDITLNIVYDHFANVKSVPLFYPFHQPPRCIQLCRAEPEFL